jgi:hypothetical protein
MDEGPLVVQSNLARRHKPHLGVEKPGQNTMHLDLRDEQKANWLEKVAVDASTLSGRKVVSVDRANGAKFSLCTKADNAAAQAKLTGEAKK